MILPGQRGDPGGARRPAARRRGDRPRGDGAGARTKLTPDRIVTAKSVENALRVLMAIGGSTNAVLHLTAIAGRAGIDIRPHRASTRSATRPRCWSI